MRTKKKNSAAGLLRCAMEFFHLFLARFFRCFILALLSFSRSKAVTLMRPRRSLEEKGKKESGSAIEEEDD